MNEPEFSRTARIDTLGSRPQVMAIDADAAEREALARRFGLVAIDHLSAEAELTRSGDVVRAEGTLSARMTQSCVATGLPVPETIEEAFAIEFRREPSSGDPDEEVELSEGELDVVFYAGGSVDLGEAVAETLSLALDPYPRVSAADEALSAAGVKSEAQAKAESSPFAGLAGLKDKLGK